MLRIAICDDSEHDRETLRETLSALPGYRRVGDLSVTAYSGGEALLVDAENGRGDFDLLFLDIYMAGINGMETARELRALGVKTPMVFLTTSPDFALESYDVNAAGYLLKPPDAEKLSRLLSKLLAPPERPRLAVKCAGRRQFCEYDELLYLESSNNVTLLHLLDGQLLRCGERLNALEEALGDKRFLRCHQSFLVNMDHIKGVDDSFTMDAIDDVIEKIDGVKKPYTKDTITDAQDAYKSLDSDQKSIFPADKKTELDALTDMLKKAEAVEALIKNLPDTYPTDGSKDAAIKAAKAAYDKLTADEKAIVDSTLKTKLDTLYKDMLDSKAAEEKAKIEAEKNFTDKVNEVLKDPSLDKIKDLLKDKEALEKDGNYDGLPQDVKNNVDNLEKAKDIIDALDKITKDNIVDKTDGGKLSEGAEKATDDYTKADQDIRDIVDKATDNKADDIKKVGDALAKIDQIPTHNDEVKNDKGEITKPATGVGEDCEKQPGGDKHHSDEHQKAIEDAKDALNQLPDSAKDLIPEDKREQVENEYEKLLRYFEYKNRDTTGKTEVEVDGLTNKVEHPADSEAAGKTVLEVVAEDSRPGNMPKTPTGKSEVLSVDVKLVAKIYTNKDDKNPISVEIVQPKIGETVTVKLLVPSGYDLKTLELWHVKDNGSRSRITDFMLTTEGGKTYAVFNVSSFSHFVFFAERTSSGDNWTPTYPPVVSKPENGSVSVTPSNPAKGDNVTVSTEPGKGYVVDKVTVTDQNGKELPVTKKPDGSYQYTQPAGKVTITVTFRPEQLFYDVPADAYYKDAVLWAAANSVTSGTSATAFTPNGICTRAQTVTFLWRAMGSPEPASTNCPFTDVNKDAYYYKAVLWAVENGITVGTSATTFSPDATVTRGQTVAFLWRAAGEPAHTAANPFGDVQSGAYYESAVLWAVAEQITEGTTAATFSPAAGCTRAQIVTFLWRYLGK